MAGLWKWAGWIETTPVEVVTDHKSLEEWAQKMSSPTGRRARWHELFSQFNLTVIYMPGTTNIVADAMSRWAYPASTARDDVCAHGSADSAQEVRLMQEAQVVKSNGIMEAILLALQVRQLMRLGIYNSHQQQVKV